MMALMVKLGRMLINELFIHIITSVFQFFLQLFNFIGGIFCNHSDLKIWVVMTAYPFLVITLLLLLDNINWNTYLYYKFSRCGWFTLRSLVFIMIHILLKTKSRSYSMGLTECLSHWYLSYQAVKSWTNLTTWYILLHLFFFYMLKSDYKPMLASFFAIRFPLVILVCILEMKPIRTTSSLFSE